MKFTEHGCRVAGERLTKAIERLGAYCIAHPEDHVAQNTLEDITAYLGSLRRFAQRLDDSVHTQETGTTLSGLSAEGTIQ